MALKIQDCINTLESKYVVVVGVTVIQRLSGFTLLLEGAGLIHIEATMHTILLGVIYFCM